MSTDEMLVAPSIHESAGKKTDRELIFEAIDAVDTDLRGINALIHDNPELCYEEFKAHENITALLKSKGLTVTPHAYGVETSFLAEYGDGGRLLIFCAEYDALPGIGHACGHNLIATASIAAFFGVVAALKETKNQGRVQLLGCPAEEGGGGKIKLINAGAFKGVDAALMLHPTPPVIERFPQVAGISYGTCLAGVRFKATFTGVAAHAGAMPWLGVNALDAASLAYSAIGMLRQQCRPTDRIGVIINEGGTSSNVITERTTVCASARSATLKEVLRLEQRIRKCFEGAAIATGCTLDITEEMDPYADLRPNEALCSEFTDIMSTFGQKFYCDLSNKDVGGYGTDMGNVSYECPSFHGTFAISIQPGENIHSAGFSRAAGTGEAHQITTQTAKGMAVTGWKVLVDEAFSKQVADDFEADRLKR